MRIPTKEDVLRVVSGFVQPLGQGIFKSVSGSKVTLKGVTENKAAPHYLHALPFGEVSNPPPVVMAYYLNLLGQVTAPIIVGHFDPNRPEAPNPGEKIVYATSPDGSTVQTSLHLTNDGGLKVTSGANELIAVGSELFQFLIDARVNTLEGPQPLFDVTGVDTLTNIKAKWDSFKRT